MRRAISFFAVAAFGFFLVSPAPAQQAADPARATGQSQSRMTGMDMGEMRHDADGEPVAARAAHDAMSGTHMEMNPHMYMTDLRSPAPEDLERAQEILGILRHSLEKYKDYRTALNDGFKIFLPSFPQPHYHFTNWRYAYEAEFVFNPAHPTSLLYKKVGNGYQLEGAMFTAPRRDTEDDLNQRVPLSIARWHKHVNLCMPPRGGDRQQVDWKKFGLGGSISTPDTCAQAGGRWVPQIFNWMVHVYPYEKDPNKIWAR